MTKNIQIFELNITKALGSKPCEGSVAEWSKALVLGTSHFDGVGSNPTAAIPFFIVVLFILRLNSV